MTIPRMTTMTDLLNDCYRRGSTVRIHAAGLLCVGEVSDVTTDFVEVINSEGFTTYLRIRSIDAVLLKP